MADPRRDAIIQELLSRPPEGVANWVLEQTDQMANGHLRVEDMPIYQLAGAFRTLPQESKEQLVRSAVRGFGDLPPSRRAEAVRVVLRAQDVVRHADEEAQHRAPIEPTRPRIGSGVVDASSLPERLERQPQEYPPNLVESILKVAKEAHVEEMSDAEVTSLARSAQREALAVVQPKQLLDVVTELDENEREQLTEALVEWKAVPEEQRGVLEEAVRPGGYADKLSSAIEGVAFLQEYAWVLIALPIFELLLSLVLHLTTTCSAPVPAWMRVDAVFALIAAGVMFAVGHTLQPAYEQLRRDPMAAVQRWQSVREGSDWRTRLERTLPGVDFETYRWAVIGVMVAMLLLIVGTIWAVVGIFEFLGALMFGCNFLASLTLLMFITVRFGVMVGMLLAMYYILDEIQKHRSRNSVLGSSSTRLDSPARVRSAPKDHREFLFRDPIPPAE